MGILEYVLIGCGVILGLVLCLALAVIGFSGQNFFEKLKENQERRNSYQITTYDYVEHINEDHFDGKLKLMRCQQYQDHYTSGIVALSEQTMQSNSLASLATISHELGHARQDRQGDKLDKLFKMRKTGRVLGFLFKPFIVAGIVLAILSLFDIISRVPFLYVAIACFGIAVLIFLFAIIEKYREIQIEKEASVFAIDYLKEILTEQELKHCKEFLDSARLTYWADLLKTVFLWTSLSRK